MSNHSICVRTNKDDLLFRIELQPPLDCVAVVLFLCHFMLMLIDALYLWVILDKNRNNFSHATANIKIGLFQNVWRHSKTKKKTSELSADCGGPLMRKRHRLDERERGKTVIFLRLLSECHRILWIFLGHKNAFWIEIMSIAFNHPDRVYNFLFAFNILHRLAIKSNGCG